MDTSSTSTIATTGGGRSGEGEDAEPQQAGKPGWDREMEEKTEGWAKEWDEERQRFYYVSLETLEATYTAPFAITVRIGSSGSFRERNTTIQDCFCPRLFKKKTLGIL